MTMIASDLSRPFILSVCAAGTVHIHEKGRAIEPGTLPVFSTNTREEADALRVRHCRLARDGSGLYALNDPPRGVDDLGRVSELFRATFEPSRCERSYRESCGRPGKPCETHRPERDARGATERANARTKIDRAARGA